MDLKFKFSLIFLLIFLHQNNIVVKATLYAFLIEDPDVFQDCKGQPGYLGAADVFDLSNFQVEFFDDHVHIDGSITMLWDADPDDRVEIISDLFKYERGSWQPTVITAIQRNFCRTLFDELDFWYKSWAQYIEEDDRKCITHKGHTYHHKPFDLETVFEISGEDLSGRHKIVVKVDAYDKMLQKQPYSICVEIVGDIIKK